MSDIARPANRLPGEEGVWVFVLGDLVVFSLFFVTFLQYRAQQLELFDTARRTLQLELGTLNTVLLLTSSWLAALAVQSLRESEPRRAQTRLRLAAGLGGGFVLVKGIEFYHQVALGHTLTSNDFYMFYFVFCGLHLVHVLVGLLFLVLMQRRVGQDTVSVRAQTMIESGAVYWHLVDVLWLILFALFYVLV